jgi:cytochrome c553
MRTATLCLFAIALATTSGLVNAAPISPAPPSPTTPAKTLAKEVCAKCHGENGTTTVANVPNLAGQREEYLAKQLQELKSHSRSDPRAVANMWSVSHTLTDKQIDGLAAHFAAQKPQPQPVEGTPEQIAVGKYISNGGTHAVGIPPCSGCHGADGEGKTIFPRLAGQHTDYLVKQLTVFQSTDQRPGGTVMKSVSHNLSPESIANVAAYFQSLGNETAH